MTFFEYTSVMVAVILALGVARILSAVGEYLVERQTTRGYWVHSLWLLFFFLMHIRIWWSYWDVRETPPTVLPAFIFMLTVPAVAYLNVYLLVPGHFPDDADAHFYAVRRPFFAIGIISVLMTIATPSVLGYQMPASFYLSLVVGVATLVLGFSLDGRRVQGLVVLMSLAGFLASFASRMTAGAFTPGG